MLSGRHLVSPAIKYPSCKNVSSIPPIYTPLQKHYHRGSADFPKTFIHKVDSSEKPKTPRSPAAVESSKLSTKNLKSFPILFVASDLQNSPPVALRCLTGFLFIVLLPTILSLRSVLPAVAERFALQFLFFTILDPKLRQVLQYRVLRLWR